MRRSCQLHGERDIVWTRLNKQREGRLGPGPSHTFNSSQNPITKILTTVMDQTETKVQSACPQKQSAKSRSKSTEEENRSKKTFHTPQKSLPVQTDIENIKMDSAPPTS